MINAGSGATSKLITCNSLQSNSCGIACYRCQCQMATSAMIRTLCVCWEAKMPSTFLTSALPTLSLSLSLYLSLLILGPADEISSPLPLFLPPSLPSHPLPIEISIKHLVRMMASPATFETSKQSASRQTRYLSVHRRRRESDRRARARSLVRSQISPPVVLPRHF